jgi:hypothetical protein
MSIEKYPPGISRYVMATSLIELVPGRRALMPGEDGTFSEFRYNVMVAKGS